MNLATSRPNGNRRRLLQFGLRELVIFVTVVGGILGWVMHRTRLLREENEHRAAIEEADGETFYSQGPHTRWQIAQHYLGRVDPLLRTHAARLDHPFDKALAHIAQLHGLKYLETGSDFPYRIIPSTRNVFRSLGDLLGENATGTSGDLASYFTDNGLRHIVNCKELESLAICLHGANVSTSGIEQLCRLTDLKEMRLCDAPTDVDVLVGVPPQIELLSVHHCLVTDKQLSKLGPLPQLKTLKLASTHVTGETLSVLDQFPKLQELDLTGCPITGLGGAKLPKIKLLSLRRTVITDDTLAELANNTSLEQLDLSYTRITDKGLAHLHALPALKSVIVASLEVTEEGYSALNAARPSLKIRLVP